MEYDIRSIIKNGSDRNIVVYDNTAKNVLTLKLINYMVIVGNDNGINITKFIFSKDSRCDILCILQNNPLLFGPPFNFTEKNLTDFKLLGRDFDFIEGLSKGEEYYKYYVDDLYGWMSVYEELVLGIDENNNCLLGCY